MTKHPKIVESNHYHVWTDALHGRALAHQARNKWDRGTYVHWCITSACTALDVACQNATKHPKFGYSFQEDLKKAVAKLGLPPLEWGSGIWQQVVALRDRRKDYIHRIERHPDLFPDANVADHAIDVVRQAIRDIYEHVGKPVPTWVADDQDRGWDRPSGTIGHVQGIHDGTDPDGLGSIRICCVSNGTEHTAHVYPAGTEWKDKLDAQPGMMNCPISEVRAYRGQELLEARQLHMRGN